MVLHDYRQAECPFYDGVPRDPAKNVSWRVLVREKAKRNLVFRKEFIAACEADILFFCNSMCWVYEPRLEQKIRPFVSWPHQEPFIRALHAHIGTDDLIGYKSRGEGATWMAIFKALHDWRFKEGAAIGFVTRNEKVVDDPDNPDSLFWKIDWSIKRWPWWFWPRGFSFKAHRSLSNHTIVNPELEGHIAGYAATADVGSGGRKNWFFFDELSKFPTGQDRDALVSLQQVTKSRLIVGTPWGAEGAFYDVVHDETSSAILLKLHWTQNPTRNIGLYRVERDGRCVDVDPAKPLTAAERQALPKIHERLRRRGFRVEGTVRSPWYDAECLRPEATPKAIAQELDMDFLGSTDLFLSKERIDALIERDTGKVEEQRFRVWADPVDGSLKLEKSPGGELTLYVPLSPEGKLSPVGKYVVSGDIAAGTGGSHSSNSALELFDAVTGEQVGELVTMHLAPHKLAQVAVALCKWAFDAFLIWESTGPFGMMFKKQVIDELSYWNIYFAEVELVGVSKRKSKKPGFHMKDDDTKATILGSVIGAAEAGLVRIRSQKALQEFTEYSMDNGKLVHRGSQRSDDQADKGKAHADRAIAIAIGYVAMQEIPSFKRELKTTAENEELREPIPGTMSWRLWEHEQRFRPADPWVA